MAIKSKAQNPKPRTSKRNTTAKSKRSPAPTKKQRSQAIANQHAALAIGAPAALVVAAATGHVPADQIVPSTVALSAGNAVGYMLRRSQA
ncbi:MAG: hypothetical protein ACFCBU_10210 [Cyanophyceae cyanobacterium]